jgi:cytochrome bd ubiquinol oxidase subunit II
MEALQITWFALWGVLWAVYFMLDGFVFGTGMLYPFLGRDENDRRRLIEAVGPVWNGNEVWLITAGGATFAAFPTTYALMFSYLYTALLLLLFSLIVRGVSIEFRNKIGGSGWTGAWDKAIAVSSFLPALLFGVAFGNLFEGLPMDRGGYHGGLFSLLNPYGLVTGLLFVGLFVVHGALYARVKTTGDLASRAESLARRAWPVLLTVAVVFLVFTAFATDLYANYLRAPALLAVPLVAVAGLVFIRVFLARGAAHRAFASSCVTIVLVCFTGVIGLFPNLIPSTLDPAYSLTIYNSSSSRITLAVMTAVALVFVPVVIAYKIWVYRVFRDPVAPEDVAQAEETY